MKAGFTGTREGMTDAQFVSLRQQIAVLRPDEFHHGCCVGADEDIGVFVYDTYPFTRVVGHPSDIKWMTSSGAVARCHELHPPKPPLARNRDIVDAVDEIGVLLVAAKGPEKLRSGTWSTVRHARKRGKRIVIVWPGGEVTEEPAKGAA